MLFELRQDHAVITECRRRERPLPFLNVSNRKNTLAIVLPLLFYLEGKAERIDEQNIKLCMYVQTVLLNNSISDM